MGVIRKSGVAISAGLRGLMLPEENRLRAVLGSVVLAVTFAASASGLTPVTTRSMSLDVRHTITSSVLEKTSPGQWQTPVVRPADEFDELVYSWHVRLPAEQGFRLYLQISFPDGHESPWLYAGFWGNVREMVSGRKKPTIPEGELDMDWLKLKQKASAFRFKVVDESTTPLTVLPSFRVITTDNSTSDTRAVVIGAVSPEVSVSGNGILDLPMRRQMLSDGTLTPNRCQSAALATALQYFGTSVPLEQILPLTFDSEYNYPGLWPRVIAAAEAFGCDGYIERFREWDAVRRTLSENKVILCSIRMDKGECTAPPYEKMGNHIVALNGITNDGRVVVTDSFLGKSGRGYRCQWLLKDFEKIWMGTKNGISMVICPPAGAQRQLIMDLPPFPEGREPITGDDH